jgi:hypothetical protein
LRIHVGRVTDHPEADSSPSPEPLTGQRVHVARNITSSGVY